MRPVLVTGAGGQIGFSLTKSLLQTGAHVVALDNFSSSNRLQLESISGTPGLEILNLDVTEDLSALGHFKEIYHLAAPASPTSYLPSPLQTIRTIRQGTENVLELARDTNARVLIASTSEIYGEPLEHPQREDYWGNVNTLGVRACYKEAKRFTETLAIEYQRQLGLEIRIARIFNTYGPGASPNDGRVVTEFLRSALAGVPLRLHANGTQTRSFCYVDDLVDGLMSFMQIDTEQVVVNLGNPHETTVRELAELVLQVTESKSPLLFEDSRLDDPSRRAPDVTLARDLLKWAARTELREGLAKTAQFMRDSPLYSQENDSLN